MYLFTYVGIYLCMYVFQTYTQYIPLSVYDLQTWMGAPSIYVYDCSNAGIIVDTFKGFAEQHEKEYEVCFPIVLFCLECTAE